MLESLLGSLVREKVLVFIHIRGSGYARQISNHFAIPHDSVHKQLKRLEAASILKSRRVGRTVVYSFCPSHRLHGEIKHLLDGIVRNAAYLDASEVCRLEPGEVPNKKSKKILLRKNLR